MGTIMDGSDGIHGEARRESFVIFDDFGKTFSVELEWEKLEALEDILCRLRRLGEERGAATKKGKSK